MKNLCIFVEGNLDEKVINYIINYCNLRDIYYDVSIVEYRTKKEDAVNSYINSLKSMKNSDYIFIADEDGYSDVRSRIKKKYREVEDDKLFIVKFQIESWIAAGINNSIKNELKIKYKFSNTEKLSKEEFDKIIPTHGYCSDKLCFVQYIMDEYDYKNACKYNESLKVFINYINSLEINN